MKKFLLLLFVIPFFINCSKLNELTSRDSKKEKSVTVEITSDIRPGENTYGVIAGALEWKDPGFSPYMKSTAYLQKDLFAESSHKVSTFLSEFLHPKGQSCYKHTEDY